jgi:hypothetical protein
MKKFVQEYGRLVVTIVALTGFFVLLGVLLSQNVSNTKSIYGIFNRNSQDSSAVYNDDFYDSVINDTVESSMAPYFEIADDADYSISENQIDWNRLFKDVKIIYDGKDVTNVNSVNGKTIEKTVLVYEYKPSIIPATGTDTNGYVETEEVYATDKYGHYIYKDANGNYNTDADYDSFTGEKVKITQPKILISNSAIFSLSNYIDCTPTSDIDNTRQYKVIYRVQIGELKAECSVNYIKNRVGSDINVSGKSKIEFSY